jgi:hypothetical protein
MVAMTDYNFSAIMLAAIVKAESGDLLRWLVPKENINPKRYGYLLHKKHPQWISGKGLQPPESYIK